MASLAETLPAEIKRVDGIRDQFKALRGMPNVIVEPQIAMMTADIDRAVKAASEGDVIEMLRAHEALKGWEG